MLENRKLAMAVDGSWALAWMHKIKAKLGTAVLPKMKQPATLLGCHMHGILAATKEPDASWKWLRFLASPWYEAQFNRIGLWLPNQTSLLTEEGLKSWITEGVHPPGFELLVTKYVPRFGHFVPMPVGMQEVTNILGAAFDSVWAGDATAEEAMAKAVPEANAAFQKGTAKGTGQSLLDQLRAQAFLADTSEVWADPCRRASLGDDFAVAWHLKD